MEELAIVIRDIFMDHFEYREERDEYVLEGTAEDFYMAVMDGITKWLQKVFKINEK